jgi:hypothetical protein
MLRKKKKSITLEEFCKLSREERQELELFEDKKQFEDMEAAI